MLFRALCLDCSYAVRHDVLTRRYLMEWGLRCQVLDMFSNLFIYIFDELKARFAREIEAVRAQHPFEDLQVGRVRAGLFDLIGYSSWVWDLDARRICPRLCVCHVCKRG
jgi:hypothetical protein